LIVSVGVLVLFYYFYPAKIYKNNSGSANVQMNNGSSQENQEIQNIIKNHNKMKQNSQPQSPPPGTVTVGTGGQINFSSSSGQLIYKC